MRTLLAILALSAIPIAAQEMPTRQQLQNRRHAITKLQTDLNTAIANAKLTDDQKKTLEEARANLSAARGKDRAAVRKALSDVRSIMQSDAFRPEDRQMIRKDLQRLRPARKAR
jgi:hypothetical protein